jgi:hypothetical protein
MATQFPPSPQSRESPLATLSRQARETAPASESRLAGESGLSADSAAADEARVRRVSPLRRLATLPLYAWRWVFTPLFPGGSAPYGCRYEPSCSHYAEEAIKTHGILRGSVMAAWRVLRCNPWSHGGYDPVRPPR